MTNNAYITMDFLHEVIPDDIFTIINRYKTDEKYKETLYQNFVLSFRQLIYKTDSYIGRRDLFNNVYEAYSSVHLSKLLTPMCDSEAAEFLKDFRNCVKNIIYYGAREVVTQIPYVEEFLKTGSKTRTFFDVMNQIKENTNKYIIINYMFFNNPEFGKYMVNGQFNENINSVIKWTYDALRNDITRTTDVLHKKSTSSNLETEE